MDIHINYYGITDTPGFLSSEHVFAEFENGGDRKILKVCFDEGKKTKSSLIGSGSKTEDRTGFGY